MLLSSQKKAYRIEVAPTTSTLCLMFFSLFKSVIHDFDY